MPTRALMRGVDAASPVRPPNGPARRKMGLIGRAWLGDLRRAQEPTRFCLCLVVTELVESGGGCVLGVPWDPVQAGCPGAHLGLSPIFRGCLDSADAGE